MLERGACLRQTFPQLSPRHPIRLDGRILQYGGDGRDLPGRPVERGHVGRDCRHGRFAVGRRLRQTRYGRVRTNHEKHLAVIRGKCAGRCGVLADADIASFEHSEDVVLCAVACCNYREGLVHHRQDLDE